MSWPCAWPARTPAAKISLSWSRPTTATRPGSSISAPTSSTGPAARAASPGSTSRRSPTTIAGLTGADDPEAGMKYAAAVGRLAEEAEARGRPGRVHRRDPAQRRRSDRPSTGLSRRSLPSRPGRGRRLHRRRGPGRLRPARHAFLGLRDPGRRPGHRRPRQADRERLPAGRGRDDRGDRRLLRQRHGVLQHLRRQSRGLRRGAGRARRHGRGEAPGARPARRRSSRRRA